MLGRLVARHRVFSMVVEVHMGKDCGDEGGVAIVVLSTMEAILL